MDKKYRVFSGYFWIRSIVGLLLIATTCFAATTRLPASGALKDGEGVVVLTITGNTNLIGQVEYVDLHSEGRKSGGTFSLRNVAPGLARDTALFIGIVPAGDYSLSQLNAGAASLSFGAGAQKLIGDIRVEAGAVADLGRVILTLIDTEPHALAGRSKISTSNIELVRTFSPENASILSLRIVNGWATPHHEEDEVERIALSHPVGADSPNELPSGEVVAASRMGSLLIRGRSGRWRAVQTGNLNSLLAVAPIVGGKVGGVDTVAIAGGEFNTLAILDSNEKLTLLSPGNLPLGNIINIQGSPEVGWFVVHQNKAKLAMYHSTQLDNGDWKPVGPGDIAFGFSTFSGVENVLWMWRTGNGFAYAVPDGRIHMFDYGTKTWTEAHAPNNNRLITISPNSLGLGIVCSASGRGGIWGSMFVSYDHGSTWSEIKSPYAAKFYAPWVMSDGSLLLEGGVMYSKVDLKGSVDRGRTWSLRSTQKKFAERLVVLPTQGLLAIDPGTNFGLGSIRHSADGGATWQLEYSSLGEPLSDEKSIN